MLFFRLGLRLNRVSVHALPLSRLALSSVVLYHVLFRLHHVLFRLCICILILCLLVMMCYRWRVDLRAVNRAAPRGLHTQARLPYPATGHQ